MITPSFSERFFSLRTVGAFKEGHLKDENRTTRARQSKFFKSEKKISAGAEGTLFMICFITAIYNYRFSCL